MTEENTDQPETILAVRIPEGQREKIRTASKLEERTESGFARFHLIKIAEAVIADSTPIETRLDEAATAEGDQ